MQGFYGSRDPEIDMSGFDNTEIRYPTTDRRAQPDRRKKDRRKSKANAKSANGLMQPILTEAEIAALLRGAR